MAKWMNKEFSRERRRSRTRHSRALADEQRNEVYRLGIIYNIEGTSMYFELRPGIQLPFFHLPLCGL